MLTMSNNYIFTRKFQAEYLAGKSKKTIIIYQNTADRGISQTPGGGRARQVRPTKTS